MRNHREELRTIQQQAQRKGQLEALVRELESQQTALQQKVRDLETAMNREQADVDKLEGRSLAAFFAGLRGNKEERLDQERQEARAARVKYDMAVLERNAVREDLLRSRAELESLADLEARRDQLMADWAAEVRAAGGPTGQAILELEGRAAAAQAQKREIREAVNAGREALTQVESILTSLDDAEGWGTWDMLGGGLLTTMCKYDALDAAQGKVEGLQLALRRFKNELVDVNISADLQLALDEFTRFADYFFDGLFMDWTVQNQINQSQARVRETRMQVQSVLTQLDTLDKIQDKTLQETQIHLEDLLLKLETE